MKYTHNLYPEKETLINILKKFGHISSNGLISIPKFGADAQAIDNKKKGLLGTLFSASWYTKHYEKSLVASLDDDKARLWLHDSRFGNERADLIGLRYDLLLYDSAVRVSELTGLRINDVDLKTLSIHIHGKGNKERSVAISEKTAAHLKRYMSIYHADGCRPEDYLFYTVIKGKVGSVSMSTVERILQKYADEARKECPDIPKHV